MKRHIILQTLFLAVVSTVWAGVRTALPVCKDGFAANELSSELWDASAKSIFDENRRDFMSINDSGFVTEYIGRSANHYILRADTLYFRGATAGRGFAALANSSAASLCMSMSVGDSCASTFMASLRYLDKKIGSIVGTVGSRVLKSGRFVFAPGDTLVATLVCESRRYTPVEVDESSGASCVETIYRWYGQGSSLPFAIQQLDSDAGVYRLHLSSWYDIALKSEDSDDETSPDTVNLSCLEVRFDGGRVTITSPNPIDEAVNIDITNMSGRSYAHAILEPEQTTSSVDISSLPAGTYLAVITYREQVRKVPLVR